MRTVMNEFLKQAELHPDNIAVLDIQGAITYERMNNLSAFLAEQILERIGGQEGCGRIALLLPRTKFYLVALLSAVRAGCAAVPMDWEYPAERVRTMAEDIRCRLCITTKARGEGLPGIPCLFLEDVFQEGTDIPDADVTMDFSDPNAQGLILYTSGSTGKPKGVIHRLHVLNVNPEAMEGILPLSETTRTLCIAGFSFIASMIDLTMLNPPPCLLLLRLVFFRRGGVGSYSSYSSSSS